LHAADRNAAAGDRRPWRCLLCWGTATRRRPHSRATAAGAARIRKAALLLGGGYQPSGLMAYVLQLLFDPTTEAERVTGIEPASRAWKALYRGMAGPALVANGQLRADLDEPWLTARDLSYPSASLNARDLGVWVWWAAGRGL
jgi:hypothetical protein